MTALDRIPPEMPNDQGVGQVINKYDVKAFTLEGQRSYLRQQALMAGLDVPEVRSLEVFGWLTTAEADEAVRRRRELLRELLP